MRILIISKIYDPAKIICFVNSTIILIDDYIYAYNKKLEFIDDTETNPLKRFFLGEKIKLISSCGFEDTFIVTKSNKIYVQGYNCRG